jgi:hypothetical protein
MAATMATLQDILKNFYIGPIRENLNKSTVLLAQLKKSSTEVVGEQVILPLHFGRNWGIGSRGTSGTGTLPTARNQQYDKAYFTTKDVYGRINISGKTIRATKTDRGAFLRSVTSETKGMTEDLSSDVNRQMYGNADGILTTIPTGSAGAQVVQTVASTQYLEEGMHIDITGGGNLLDNTIASIDSETQITLAVAVDTADADVIRIAGTGATDELNGLNLITNNTGSLQNIDPASVSVWKGNVFGSDAAPVALNEDDMQEAQDAAEIRGGKIDFIVTSYPGKRKYVALLAAQKRYTTPQVGKLKGGYSYIDFNDIPLVVDRHCQASPTASRFYFLTLKDLGIYRMADFDWMKEDGNILARQVGSSATESYEGTLVCDMEFATTARRHQSVLKGVSVA